MDSPLLTRSQLGLRPARNRSTNITPRHLTGHYAGLSPWRGGFDHARCASIWRGWQDFHIGTRGWSDIAYNSGVCPHGVRMEGRGPGVRSAANGTNAGNAASYATCYIAGQGDPLTDEAKVAFLAEAARFRVPLDRAHSDWKPTACPGDPLRDWIHQGAPLPSKYVPMPQPAPPVLPPEGLMFPIVYARDSESGAIYAFTATHYQHLTADEWEMRVKEGAKAVDLHPWVIAARAMSRRKA